MDRAENGAFPGRRGPSRWGWIGLGATTTSAVGYTIQTKLGYVSKPALVGELEFYGFFAAVAFVALMAGAVAAEPAPGRRGASRLGWIAVGATVMSVIGYVVQTILDHVDEPALVGEIEFYGLFVGFAIVALIAGTAAVMRGRRRGDLTMRLGFIAVGYVLLAQAIQSLWD
jgi:hypothetical protein